MTKGIQYWLGLREHHVPCLQNLRKGVTSESLKIRVKPNDPLPKQLLNKFNDAIKLCESKLVEIVSTYHEEMKSIANFNIKKISKD